MIAFQQDETHTYYIAEKIFGQLGFQEYVDISEVHSPRDFTIFRFRCQAGVEGGLSTGKHREDSIPN